MPHELIASTPSSNRVEVRWGGPEGSLVQLVTTSDTRLVAATIERTAQSDWRDTIEHNGGDLTLLGVPHVDDRFKADAEVMSIELRRLLCPEAFPFDGWFADLDRYDVNRLIKALRRARNTQFGSDE